MLPKDVVAYVDRCFTKKGLNEARIGRKRKNYPKRSQVRTDTHLLLKQICSLLCSGQEVRSVMDNDSMSHVGTICGIKLGAGL